MRLYSNEIVFRGHPDKACDQISDALLDAYLKEDKHSRCGIEVMGGKGIILVTGEVTSKANVDVKMVVKRVLNDIGYHDNYEIINNLGVQSKDIALGTNDEAGGAGDNGMMFGYATKETDKLLPKAMVILQELSIFYDDLRKKDKRFLADGKAQITGYYDENDYLIKIKDFTICYQNTEEEREETDNILKNKAIDIAKKYNVDVENFLINPTGKFQIGGFEGDAGLTGRKIVVDSYQSFAKVGGGAFSGKDPSKVDRSGAYMARKIAKEILLANNDITSCEVQISYAIGIDRPLSINIKTNKGYIDTPDSLYERCKVKKIINELDLLNTSFEKMAMFGHFIN